MVKDSSGNSLVSDPANKLVLGDLFKADSIDASVPFTTLSGIDSARDLVRFAIPHNFQMGDAVRYSANGHGNIGLTEGTTYYVRVLDPFSIELYNNVADAMADASRFRQGDVSSNYINIANSFANGQAVTYQCACADPVHQPRRGRVGNQWRRHAVSLVGG